MITISEDEVDRLLPMHLFVTGSGDITSMGRTLRKFFPDFPAAITQLHLTGIDSQKAPFVQFAGMADREERIILHHPSPGLAPFRGHVTRAVNGFLLDFGFGIALRKVTQDYGLSYTDFSPVSLAMDALFLHEANSWILAELSRNNDALDQARVVAEQKAHQDPLTGLANRRGLELALAPLSDVSQNTLEFTILNLDLDYFKAVNDQFGHAAGDIVLQKVGEILKCETRASDIVARVGGDEFVMVLNNLTNIHQLTQFTERLINRLEQPIETPQGVAHISASIGLARSGDFIGNNITTMIAHADAALYNAKKQGRGRAVFADRSVE